MALFGASVVGLLAFVYWSTIGVIDDQTDAAIEADIAGLAEQYRRHGLAGLVDVVARRVAEDPERRALYLVVDQAQRPVAGNIAAWPVPADTAPGWIEFLVQPANRGGSPVPARARTFQLPEGLRLLVGRDLSESLHFRRLMADALVGALILTVLLGLAGGIVMSRNLLSRLDAINRNSLAILNGDLRRRMPLRGTGDEFDRLSANLNAMLDQIERLIASLREVSDNIAHDMRSPISRLRSRLEVTLMGAADVDTYRATLEQTIAEVDHILHTFNALLNIALVESGTRRDGFQAIDVATIAEDAAALYAPVYEDRGLRFSTAIEGPLHAVGDPRLLFQAITNLLDNAAKYTPAAGGVTLTARRQGGRIVVAVADSGPGIPAEDRERVVQRFARLERSRSTPGSGLGLSLVKAVADLHDADLVLDDNGPGLRAFLALPAGIGDREPAA